MLPDAIVAVAGEGDLVALDVAYAVQDVTATIAEEHNVAYVQSLALGVR
jgi:hypothetical protein